VFSLQIKLVLPRRKKLGAKTTVSVQQHGINKTKTSDLLKSKETKAKKPQKTNPKHLIFLISRCMEKRSSFLRFQAMFLW